MSLNSVNYLLFLVIGFIFALSFIDVLLEGGKSAKKQGGY